MNPAEPKTVYLIRHCKAVGQEPEAPLTEMGFRDAGELGSFLSACPIERLYASPFLRARDTIRPLAERLRLPVHTEERLKERVLSGGPLEDWMEKLRRTYDEPDLAYPGGESSRAAAERALSFLKELLQRPEKTMAAVTHGALLSLILRHFDARFGFEEWSRMRNPDVYRLELTGTAPGEGRWEPVPLP